ncbi:MAG: riboflavin synthase [Longimicrobiales bacterium]
MFTGLIEEVGVVAAVTEMETGTGRRLVIRAPRIAASACAGDSIAVDGACLTVVAARSEAGRSDSDPGLCLSVDVIPTTLARTTLGGLSVGDAVNLERALALGSRLGGHFVQGHVDGVGTVADLGRAAEEVRLTVTLPEDVAEVTVPRGSIAIQGVSLTVAELPAPALARVSLIPYTWEHTSLSRLVEGAGVNLEGDLLGRFVVQHLKRTGAWRV